MEEWKKPVVVGVALIVLAIMFAAATKSFNMWTVLIIVIAVLDIILGFYRKKIE